MTEVRGREAVSNLSCSNNSYEKRLLIDGLMESFLEKSLSNVHTPTILASNSIVKYTLAGSRKVLSKAGGVMPGPRLLPASQQTAWMVSSLLCQ